MANTWRSTRKAQGKIAMPKLRASAASGHFSPPVPGNTLSGFTSDGEYAIDGLFLRLVAPAGERQTGFLCQPQVLSLVTARLPRA